MILRIQSVGQKKKYAIRARLPILLDMFYEVGDNHSKIGDEVL